MKKISQKTTELHKQNLITASCLNFLWFISDAEESSKKLHFYTVMFKKTVNLYFVNLNHNMHAYILFIDRIKNCLHWSYEIKISEWDIECPD